MKEKLFHPATIISAIALFVALSGTSYAISQLPKNSVGSKQIKKNAVTASKVKDGSLLASDFKSGQLPRGERGPQGEVGAQGATGPQGAAGPQGASPVLNYMSASTSSDQTLSTKGFPLTVLDAADGGNDSVTVSSDSRLVASATATLFKASSEPAATADASCNIFLFPTGSVGFAISQTMRATLDLTEEAGGGTGPQGHATISMVANRDVGAGTYDVQVLCQRSSTSGDSDATATPIFSGGDLSVQFLSK